MATLAWNRVREQRRGICLLPGGHYLGGDSFTYTIMDSAGLTSTATVTVLVTAPVASPALPPVAANLYYLVTSGQSLPISGPSILNIDADPSNLFLSLKAFGTPAHGFLTVNSDYGFTYTPFAGYTGERLVSYTIANSAGLTSSGAVTVAVSRRSHRLCSSIQFSRRF